MPDWIRGMAAGLITAAVIYFGLLARPGEMSLPWAAPNAPEGTIRVITEESAVIDAVKKASPAVVSIVASADVPRLERCYRDPFQGVPGFGNFKFQVPDVCQNGTVNQQTGAGTGFIVSEDGYVMTNRHVVDGREGTQYTVILNDEAHRGEKVAATVLARDSGNDIAVLKIDMAGLPFLSFADSSALQVGQTAIAIGYSLGEFENTVSKGVVSGLSRSITAGDGLGMSERLTGVIQSDAAINPGNSGGPLLDLNGDVIGMNSAMAALAQTIGFAIPGNDVKAAYDSVRRTGKIERAWLGVRFAPVTPEVKEELGLAYDYGVLVVRGEKPTDLAVVPGSPADKAGIVENDIILEVDGQKLDEDHPLPSLVTKGGVGKTVSIKVSHKGDEKVVQATLAARPE